MKKHFKRSLTAVIGGLVLAVGALLIPYPGPGWLIVFTGLGILSTEFSWARRVLHFAKSKYDLWTDWVARQNSFIKALIWSATALVVVVTIWLVNGYGLLNEWLQLKQDWAESPLF